MSINSIPVRAPGLGLRGASGPGSSRDASRPATWAQRLTARPELLGVLAVAALLNLWNLSVNGTANVYYAAAVKAMASNWHDFFYNAMDKSGLMTVDKPPLSDWIQALSVRVFGWSSWSLLVPQAIMGVIAAGLMYDLVRRRFGRAAGFAAGLVLATTPTIVAVSRHNNPDELLVMLSVLAVWCFMRALDTGRTRWLVLTGLSIGLGFETKMGVALMLVPALALAWVWTRWEHVPGVFTRKLRANLRMFRQLVYGGLTLAVAGLAWPVFVWLTPASSRPWVSGTQSNSIWSLIFGYNGLGRIAGQSGGPSGAAGGLSTAGLPAGGFPGGGHGFAGGGPGGAGNSLFGGATGPFRLLQQSLGDQAGWLLGAALVVLVGLVVMTRLRRNDPRTGFVIAIGGTLLTVGVVFSYASGIFHPYYVSMVAPWAAALIGAGVGIALGGGRSARIVVPLAIVGGVITELIVLGELNGQLSWAVPVVAVLGIGSALALALQLPTRVRRAALLVASVGLLAAPTTWAAETLGHAESGTFPLGGSSSVNAGTPGAGGGPGGGARSFGSSGGGAAGFAAGGFPGGASGTGGAAGSSASAGLAGPPAGFGGGTASSGGIGSAGGPGGAGGGGAGGGFGAGSGQLDAAAAWAKAHGGGTVAVDSQSTAASAIIAGYDNVAGIGGFSGNESTVTAKWLASMVEQGRIRYLLGGSSTEGSAFSDGRQGSRAAISLAEKVAKKITVTYDGQTFTLYDLQGKAAAILAAAKA